MNSSNAAAKATVRLRLILVCKSIVVSLLLTAAVLTFAVAASAHPLGNFTINHFARLSVEAERVRVRYVIDMAEIPAFQALREMDTNGDGTASDGERKEYLERAARDYTEKLRVSVDNINVPLVPLKRNLTAPPGVGNLPTLRVECDYEGVLPKGDIDAGRRLRFENNNYGERAGWREVVVEPAAGVAVFNSTAYGSAITDELKTYPEDRLAAPLDERTAELTFARGVIPADAAALMTREGKAAAAKSPDRLAELIAAPELTLQIALIGLVVAFFLGAAHALSPGHGKAIVGAYLVGSRGTLEHAAFLGLTVTVTHTAGVFALGLVTLFAAEYVVPETLLPALGLISGLIVVAIGIHLFVRRASAAFGFAAPDDHRHDDEDTHSVLHSHDGGELHSHLPPGADGAPITWRGLLALGVSGGLLPCPSALVVLLSAIALGRVGFGLLLVAAFSLGLATTLTVVGLLFLYAGRLLKGAAQSSVLTKVLPPFSALVITLLGVVICYEALLQSGFETASLFGSPETIDLGTFSAASVLLLGLVFGLKHATEADHVVAVSTIVSEHRNWWRAATVGGLWGVGHTISLVVVGIFVLGFSLSIPERVAGWLEFLVALMIIGLGANVLMRTLRRRSGAPINTHSRNGITHAHLDFHNRAYERGLHNSKDTTSHSHAVSGAGIKPILVGAMHGLAGSGALTLLVLSQINSVALGLLYLFVFGVGSILGMLVMSGLIGLPFVFAVRRMSGWSYGLQTAASVLSIAFGFWYAYETATEANLFGIVG